MRNEVRSNIVAQIGNGSKVSMWFDSWAPFGALNRFVSYRDLYDARFRASMTVREFVIDEGGHWPDDWHDKFPIITQLQPIVLDHGKKDSLVWKMSDGSLKKFSISKVYSELHDGGDVVRWNKLIWFSQNIPKHAFILWLAVQGKLPTQDRIRRCGSYDLVVCSLCHSDIDSHDHLFFNCSYTSEFWAKVMHKLKMHNSNTKWEKVIDSFVE